MATIDVTYGVRTAAEEVIHQGGVVLAISIDIVNLQLPALGQDQEGAESSSSFLLFEEGSEDILARGTSSPRRNHCPSEN